MKLKHELKDALTQALDEFFLANDDFEIWGATYCAKRFYDSHAELMEQLAKAWALDRLSTLFRHRRQRGWPTHIKREQLILPGFENLPYNISIGSGNVKRLNNATVPQIRRHLEMLRRYQSKEVLEIGQLQAVLELMKKYTSKTPRITWGEVKRKEIEAQTRSL
jgi:hypothetical protein